LNTAWLLEAAIRTLLMGAITLVALHVLRIDQIRARRTAWLLALGGALLMPLLVAAHIGPRILPEFTRPEPAKFSAESGLAAAVPVYEATTPASDWTQPSESATPAIIAPTTTPSGESLKQQLASIAMKSYLGVAALLLLRLGFGLAIALRLKWRAQRIDAQTLADVDPGADVRVSAQLANPVTVTSSILLPRNYLQWDASTLRIVLSHEFAHVRQKDFYVQLLAGLHCALFWFNPFSWWLQRQLSDLGEALSDHAAAQQADSRVSYAEILLSFAAGGDLPAAAVAMARSSNLTPRIERLLSEQGFERSFSSRPRLPFAAAGIVMMALIASTSVKRVDAAAADITVTPPAQETPQQPPEVAPWPDAPPAADAPMPPAPAPKKPVPARPPRPIPPLIAYAPPVPGPPPVPTVRNDRDISLGTWVDIDDGGVSYMKIDKDEAFLIKLGDSRIRFNSDYKKRFGKQMPNVDGDLILYQREGKPYLIQDPAILAKAQELFAPLKDNRLRRDAEYAQLRANLSEHRRALHEAQAQMKLSAPEFRAAMEEVSKQLDQLKAEKVSLTMDQETLTTLQSKLGNIQGRLGQLQAELSVQSGDRELANEQSAQLQAEQSEHLADTNQRTIDAAQRELKPLIEQAIKDGRAKPVN
jgi:beta-lactamase regulating signal transducer with metallopeptidase domain/predicted  nucleic acid-binding Zn-ribbon protein